MTNSSVTVNIHTYIHIDIHRGIHTHGHACTGTHIYTYATHACRHTRTLKYMHAQAHTRHMYVQANTCTHTSTQTHTPPHTTHFCHLLSVISCCCSLEMEFGNCQVFKTLLIRLSMANRFRWERGPTFYDNSFHLHLFNPLLTLFRLSLFEINFENNGELRHASVTRVCIT